MTLTEGTGPAAIATIRADMGEIPVVYISATARVYCTEDRLTRAFAKPLDRPAIASAFHELRHLSRA